MGSGSGTTTAAGWTGTGCTALMMRLGRGGSWEGGGGRGAGTIHQHFEDRARGEGREGTGGEGLLVDGHGDAEASGDVHVHLVPGRAPDVGVCRLDGPLKGRRPSHGNARLSSPNPLPRSEAKVKRWDGLEFDGDPGGPEGSDVS